MILEIERPVVSVVLGITLLPVHDTEKDIKSLRSRKKKMPSERAKKRHDKNGDQRDLRRL